MIRTRAGWLGVIVCAGLLLISLIPENPLYQLNWALLSVMVLAAALVFFFLLFDRRSPDPRQITLTAALAALAAAIRIPFAVIPSLQPTTFLVMISGRVFGPGTGFMVGALAALGSNLFLGQGPWTPWQMFAWGLAGAAAGLFRQRENFRWWAFALFCGLWGFLFGWIMNIWHWIGFVSPLNLKTFIATYLASVPFDSLHAAGNLAFALLLGRPCYHILCRYRARMQVNGPEKPKKLENSGDFIGL